MRICLILEGSYPYVRGGVSTWADGYIKAMPEHEFVLWVIGANEKLKGNFKYEIPENVVEIREVFLDGALHVLEKRKKRKGDAFTQTEIQEHRELFNFGDPDLEVLAGAYQEKKLSAQSFLMSQVFLQDILLACEEKYPFIPMTEFFHAIRSMFIPVFHMISQDIPEADVYHSVSTGYAGLLGSLATVIKKKPFVLTEHGIYMREREEEVIRADWISFYFKPLWIQLFHLISQIAYQHAASVTSLFQRASDMQGELGCDPKKLRVIRNGIDTARFVQIPKKAESRYIDIGAVVRFHPIKDIKTMIYAFNELKRTVPTARLHILGGIDDESYYIECRNLIKMLQVPDVIIPGNVNIVEYMEGLDFTILTSISEGQPLSVLESLAAGRPCVTTDVGCCRELLEGFEGDELGAAGFVVPPMHPQKLAERMEQLCRNEELRKKMSASGKERVKRYYRREEMIQTYLQNYEEVQEQWQALALN